MGGLKTRYDRVGQAVRSWTSTQPEVAGEAVVTDMVRILWTAPVMGVACLLAALGFLFKEPSVIPTEALWRMWVMGINFALAFLDFLFMLGAWLIRNKRASLQIQTVFLHGVIIYALGAGLLLSIIDQLVIPSITPMIISVALVGTFYYLPPRNSFIIFAGFFLCFRFSFQYFTNTPDNILASILTNGLVVCLLGLALSLVNWGHFSRLKLQQKTIAEQQRLLEQMAYQDSLTGLPNRRWLDQLITEEAALVRREQGQACLIILDIDDFKRINDTYGHPVGDALLHDFARLLQNNIRQGSILGRMGGEEFIILVRGIAAEQGRILAERLRSQIAEHVFRVNGNEIAVTASFGVAMLPGLGSLEDCYSQADQALYQAKHSGKNRVTVVDLGPT